MLRFIRYRLDNDMNIFIFHNEHSHSWSRVIAISPASIDFIIAKKPISLQVHLLDLFYLADVGQAQSSAARDYGKPENPITTLRVFWRDGKSTCANIQNYADDDDEIRLGIATTWTLLRCGSARWYNSTMIAWPRFGLLEKHTFRRESGWA